MMKVDYYLLLQCDWHLITKKKHTSPSYFRFDIKPWIFLTLGFSADVSGLGSKTRTGWPGSGTVVETLKLKSSWHVLIDDLYTSWSINFQSFSVWNQISFFWSSFSCSRDWWVELSSHSPALGAFGYPPPDAAVYHALATRSAGLPGKTTPKWTVFFFLLVFSISILWWWVHNCLKIFGSGFFFVLAAACCRAMAFPIWRMLLSGPVGVCLGWNHASYIQSPFSWANKIMDQVTLWLGLDSGNPGVVNMKVSMWWKPW